MKLHYKTPWSDTFDFTFTVCQYQSNGNLAIQSYEWSEGQPEPFDMLTVNLSGKCESVCAFVDVNNSPWLEQFLTSTGLAKPTGRKEQSGWVLYPEYRFDMNKLEKYDNGLEVARMVRRIAINLER